jgi:hypothetical protein
MNPINRYETKASPNYQMPAANHSCKWEAYLLNLYARLNKQNSGFGARIELNF